MSELRRALSYSGWSVPQEMDYDDNLPQTSAQSEPQETHNPIDPPPSEEGRALVPADAPMSEEGSPAEIIHEQLQPIIQTLSTMRDLDTTQTILLLNDTLNKIPQGNKDVAIEQLAPLVNNLRDENGNKVFKDITKTRDFLRLLAYPNSRDNYHVPKSLYRSISHVGRISKVSPLMKRELNSMSRY